LQTTTTGAKAQPICDRYAALKRRSSTVAAEFFFDHDGAMVAAGNVLSYNNLDALVRSTIRLGGDG